MNELSLLDTLFDVMDTAASCNYGICTPNVDVIEDDKAYTLEMELPGKSENDVEIELNKDKLTISSKNVKEAKEDKKTKYLIKERRNADFKRSFTLPSDVDSETICASFKNGVLTITMEKKADLAPKKIEIKVA